MSNGLKTVIYFGSITEMTYLLWASRFDARRNENGKFLIGINRGIEGRTKATYRY